MIWQAGWRYQAQLEAFDDAALYVGAHRVETERRPPVERGLGDDCDAIGVASVCAAGLACSVDAECIVSAPPVVAAAAYNAGRVWATVHVRGQDVDADVAAIELREGDRVETYAVDGWRQIADPNWHIGVEHGEEGAFELLWGFDKREGNLMREVELVVIDREGNRSAPFATGWGFLDGRDGNTWLPEGALCDVSQSGFVGTCVDRNCVLRDGDDAYRCLPVAACESPERFTAIEGDRVEGTTRGAEDDTWLSCAPPVPGLERGFRIDAAADELVRVHVEGERLTAISLRATCDRIGGHARTQCSGAETVAGTDVLTVERWMAAGETAWLIVEAFGTAEFTVSIERIPPP